MSWLNLTHNTKYASDEMSVLHCATEGRMAGVPNVVGAGLGDTWESKNMDKDIVYGIISRNGWTPTTKRGPGYSRRPATIMAHQRSGLGAG